MLRLVRNLFSSMSLERKCLLFFGSALLCLMFLAFLVVEKLGRELVKNYPRNRAIDFSTGEVLRRHLDSIWSDSLDEQTVAEKRLLVSEVRQSILSDDEETRIEYVIVGSQPPPPPVDADGSIAAPESSPSQTATLAATADQRSTATAADFNQSQYKDLPSPMPADGLKEQELLRELEFEYRLELARIIAKDRPDVTHELDLGENNPMNQISPGTRPKMHREQTVGKRGIYYIPIFFKPECMTCHAPADGFSLDPQGDPIELANQYPFRVGKVSMAYKQTHEATTEIRAIVVALGMLIVAVTLFFLHAIVRHLVLVPMYHLRDVADRITRGDASERAVIETDDEFRELADAFNRMLRHMTETQDQLQDVNNELDSRVDQLAQLNLQLYEANRLKSDFLANMSHELRTPLNSIIGFSEVLHGIDSLTEKQRRYASNIQKSGRLLLEMINDILDLAKVEAGKMEVKPAPCKLDRLVNAQCDMMASLVEEKRLVLDINVDNLPDAHQDANKLGQIVNNLLSNAIKFTPEGGLITVSVTDETQSGSRRGFRLRVTDTGIGIASEDQDVIFEKFRQSKKVLDGEGLTREYAGTGLGLSIVKELAKLLGGEVNFESELGRGTSFWVTLPYHLRAEPAVAA